MHAARDVRTLLRHTACRAEPAHGALRQSGARVTTLSPECVHALHASFVEQFADNAADLLYRWGYECGLQLMIALNQRLRADLNEKNDLWQMDTRFVFDSWWAPFAATGWGNCSFDTTKTTRDIVIIELQSSVVASALGPTDEPVCHLYAGLFAAAVSFFERTERHAAELQCAGMGAANCQFIVGSGADVDSAETWRQQGTSAAEILRRLR